VAGISTGALSLDIALGGNGIPRGRTCELFGPEASGKTTLALHVVANAQKAGGVAAFIDAEYALDTTWAKKIGVDTNSMLVSQPDTGEQALSITEMLIKSNAVDIIVIDSVAALVPAAELQGEMGQKRRCPAVWIGARRPAPRERHISQRHNCTALRYSPKRLLAVPVHFILNMTRPDDLHLVNALSVPCLILRHFSHDIASPGPTRRRLRFSCS
ncbi:MAG: hypothetical protein IIB62_05225, partial [Proteobacteria bacterium]|nr:hypothetical protein [Pseudomonadota bacterium]